MAETNSSTQIEWRPIPDFPAYRVSNTGEVQSCLQQIGLGTGKGTKSVLSST